MNKFIIGLLLMAISGYSAIREETQQFQYVDTVAFQNPVRIGYYDNVNTTFSPSDFPVALLISTTDGIGIPTGTTAQRPTGDLEYAILRYNSETEHIEYNTEGTTWVDLLSLEDSNIAAIIASIDAHVADTDNPHGLVTGDLGLDGTDGGFKGGIAALADSGGAIGQNAFTTSGGAVGKDSSASGGGAVGYDADTTDGGAIGMDAFSEDGGAVGKDAVATDGFSGGAGAKSELNAIQLGLGTNLTLNTLQVYDKQLLDANGIIPMARMHPDATTDEELTQLGSDTETAYILADSTLSNNFESSLYSFVYGEDVWDEPITSNWTAIVDELAVITNEHPRGVWFRYSESKQYVNAEEQLVLIVRDDGGGILDGYTIGAAISLPSSYFNGAGIYYLKFKIVEYFTPNSRLAVNITGANIGTGGESNHYDIKTRRSGGVGNPLEIDDVGNSFIEDLNNKIYNPIEYPEGNYYILEFTHNGDDDVVLQFGGAGMNDNINNGVVIDDILLSKDNAMNLLNLQSQITLNNDDLQASDVDLQSQITSNSNDLQITATQITTISNSVYGETFWSDPITTNWTAITDATAQISAEHPRRQWFNYDGLRQYVNAEEQLVLKVVDIGGITDGYTAGVGIAIPGNYFLDGAGDYYLLFKIEEYENPSSLLAVSITEAKQGSGGLDNYYTIRTLTTDYGIPLRTTTTGDATIGATVEKVYNSEDHPSGSFYRLDFTYNGIDDVVLQFAGASIDNNSARSVIINDIVIPQKEQTHILRTDNPHAVTKAHVALGDVDNTSDMDKPVSTSQGLINSILESTLTTQEAKTESLIYGNVFFQELFPLDWTAIVVFDGAQLTHAYPKEEWFRNDADRQYINEVNQLVLMTRDTLGAENGYTTGIGISLPSTYFNGEGIYSLSLSIIDYQTVSSRLTVKVSEANEGSGGTNNYYIVKTQYAGWEEYAHQMMVPVVGDATSSILAEHICDPINQPAGTLYKLEFTYGGTNDVVVQIGGAGINNSARQGAVIDDVYIAQGGVVTVSDTLKADIDAENVVDDDIFRLNIGLGTASTNSTESFIQSTQIDQNSGVAGLDENGHISTNAIPDITVIFTGGAR